MDSSILAYHAVTKFVPVALRRVGMVTEAEKLEALPRTSTKDELSTHAYDAYLAADAYASAAWADDIDDTDYDPDYPQYTAFLAYAYADDPCNDSIVDVASAAAYAHTTAQLWLDALADSMGDDYATFIDQFRVEDYVPVRNSSPVTWEDVLAEIMNSALLHPDRELRAPMVPCED